MANIITISREFGSGGRELGKRLADVLGYDYYDREIITEISKKYQLNEDFVEQTLNKQVWKTVPLNYGRTISYFNTMHTSLDSMGKVSLMMDLISQRQRALGSNVANVNTPGYIRQDINFGQYLSSMNSPLETRLSEKLGPSAIAMDRTEEPVNAANELLQLQENSILYSMATRRMTNIVTEMKTVINVGK